MNDVASLLLWSLGRTTLWLAAAALITALILRVGRPTWPSAHRLAWLVVLLVGWSFIRLPLTVPWYAAPSPEPTATAELAPNEPAPGERLVDRESTFEVIELAPPSNDEPATAPAAIVIPDIVAPPVAANGFDWPLALLGAWALGGVALVAAWGIGYVMFVRSLAARVPVGEVYQAEWHELLAVEGVRREIPLCTTEKFGPLLCRLPRGFEIIVPESLWRELTTPERMAILRHELAHYQRGDVWSSLVARVLALPHWFNPAAWWAARQFDEAAEWACDRAAVGDDATTDYANALVRLGQVSPQATFYGTAARGRSLAARIRRVLDVPTTEDPLMKKASLIAIMLGLAAASIVQIDLVAQQPTAEVTKSAEEAEPIKANAPLGDEQPDARPTTSPYLNLLQSKKAPADGLESPEEPKAKASLAAVQEMVDEARAAYEANLAAYEAGTATMDWVYDWSLAWMRAAQAAATDDLQKTAAIQAHLDRMRNLQKKIGLLYKLGSRGGEAKEMRPANFYVAEAERWLAEADVPATHRGGNAAKREPAAEAMQVVDLRIKIAEIAGQVQLNQVELRTANESLSSRKLSETETARLRGESSKLEAQHINLMEQLKLHEYKLKLLTSKSVPQQETVQDRSLPTSKPTKLDPANRAAAGAGANVRYEGKDFDSWAEELRNDLSPSRRAEAIRALAAFGAHGQGTQVAKLILQTGRDYSMQVNGNPDAQAAVHAFQRMPINDIWPLIVESLESGNPIERRFALILLINVAGSEREIAPYLLRLLKDMDTELRQEAAFILFQREPVPPELVAALREWLASDDPARVAFAARALDGADRLGRQAKRRVEKQLLVELLPDWLQAIERPEPYGSLVEQAMDSLDAFAASVITEALSATKLDPGPRAKQLLDKLGKKAKPMSLNSSQ